MGVSTDAILVFGMEIEGESEDSEKIDAIMEEDDDEGGTSGYDRLSEAEKKTGAEVIFHCSAECTMYIVGTRAMTANRGYPVAVDPKKLALTKAQIEADLAAIEALCGFIGIPFKPKKCKWWLCSNWS
jgi:hypothetical protein